MLGLQRRDAYVRLGLLGLGLELGFGLALGFGLQLGLGLGSELVLGLGKDK